MDQSKNVRWAPVLAEAKQIVDQYDTAITLRQLFYRLVVARLIPNTQNYYRTLSAKTAEGRRKGTFPDLLDQRGFHRQALSFKNHRAALGYTQRIFRLDRTAGQDYQIWIGGEKATLLGQLDDWFFDFGVNIVVGGGYYSQTSCGEIRKAVRKDRRDAILIYGGDHDPSGHDIQRDLEERTRCWTEVIRVAVGPDEVEQFDLPENPGKDTDPRADAFIAEFGELVQVEIEALDPDDLHTLYQDVFEQYWDDDAYQAVSVEEEAERAKILPEDPDPEQVAYLIQHAPDLAPGVISGKTSVADAYATARHRTTTPAPARPRRLRRPQ